MSENRDLEKLRHSAAHLLAHAVIELFPDTILTIGPATPEGFFYDFLPRVNFKEEDLPIIEAKMQEIVAQNIPLTHTQISKEQARQLYKNNIYKTELIDAIPGDTVGLAEQGTFYDLCRGGHVTSTGDIKYFKLISISGSYWRANKDGQQLQRISGTAFYTQKDLEEYQKNKEEIALYDHRRLGKELDLFSFHEEGVGFPFYHPNGKRIINTLMSYLRSLLLEAGYDEIATPTMLSDKLWRRSGHYQHYKDNMYFSTIDEGQEKGQEEEQYALKPMNCPGAIILFGQRKRSYRELPLRLAEFGHVHRHELSGTLHGLFRARAFTQDDAHIFCMINQIQDEVQNIISMSYNVLKRFEFTNISIGLSTRPTTFLGSLELWDSATAALKEALRRSNLSYTINEGDGAFYGPKIDMTIEDGMGRTWQCGTIQLDFFQPENFDLHYTNSEGTNSYPVIIHRTIYGSLERFLGIVLEHYKGKLPFWLAPVQLRILTITDEQKEYAQTIHNGLKKQGIRIETDHSSDQISAQIKRAQLQRIPWMLVIGKKEAANSTVTLRYYDGTQEFGLSLDAIIEKAYAANAY